MNKPRHRDGPIPKSTIFPHDDYSARLRRRRHERYVIGALSWLALALVAMWAIATFN